MRSREEIELLIGEVQNAMQFYSSKKDNIEAEILLHQIESDYNTCAKVLLIRLLQNTSKLHQDMMYTYKIMKEETEYDEQESIYSSDSNSDIDC